MSKKSKGRQDHQHPGTDQPASDKENINRHVYVEPGVQIDFVEDLKQKYKTNQTQNTTHSNRQLFWTKVSAVLLFIYAGLTAWQGWLTRESIDNNTRQFQIDQRPYLWTTEKRPETTIQAGQRMWANIELVDFGKSPATKVSIAGKIYIGPSAMADAYKWFDNLGNKPLPPSNAGTTVVMPGIPSVFPSIAGNSDPSKPAKAPAGGFGGGGFFTVQSDSVLNQPQVDQVLQTEGYAVMVMRLQYFDGFGNRYWSDVCMYRLVNGNIPFCNQHTEVH